MGGRDERHTGLNFLQLLVQFCLNMLQRLRWCQKDMAMFHRFLHRRPPGYDIKDSNAIHILGMSPPRHCGSQKGYSEDQVEES